MAFTALLMAFYRQSKRRTAEFLGTLLGQPCCPALAVKMQNQVTAALRPSYEAGERSLRHAVIWRKLSFGTQSASGSRFVETMLTVIETCRQQRHNASSFLTAAVEAHLAHQSAPPLLSRA
jgi:hypothetical protein